MGGVRWEGWSVFNGNGVSVWEDEKNPGGGW